jgi:catechol 2,3-dioxygenase-like lactoylglutathione lyase family enzyme
MNDADFGLPPSKGWAKLVPEIYVTRFEKSVRHWCDVFGFTVAYQRPDEKFAYLERPEGCQIMVCERGDYWETGPFEHPFGRGVLLQIFIDDVDALHDNILRQGFTLYDGPREVWRRWGDREGGKKEILVQDPDGYLAMFAQDIGERALPEAAKKPVSFGQKS